jgi:hypothetical protein
MLRQFVELLLDPKFRSRVDPSDVAFLLLRAKKSGR